MQVNEFKMREGFGRLRTDNSMNTNRSKKMAYRPMDSNEDSFGPTILDMVSDIGEDYLM